MAENTLSGKWGTHVEVCDESDQSLMDFVHDAARDTMRHQGLVPLEGPCERTVIQLSEDATAYALFLWPYERPAMVNGSYPSSTSEEDAR